MSARQIPSPSGNALYRVLAPGRQAMSPEQVAAHQRSRLQGAMVAAVAEQGYGATSVTRLVSLAGVSRSTFYKHFSGKEQCFLATYDAIAAMAVERVSRAYRTPTNWQERLDGAFRAFAQIIIDEPQASHLVLVDSLGVGHCALAHSERLMSSFELMLAQSFAAAPHRAQITDTTIRAIVAGIRRVAYQQLLREQPEQLNDLLEGLKAWTLAYYAPGRRLPQRPVNTSPKGAKRLHPTPPDATIETLDLATARATLSQRQRILHAIVSLVCADGHGMPSIPEISARAGTSNETFYEHFPSKQHALLAAYEESADRALASITTAFAGAANWPRAISAAIARLLEHVAEDEILARLAFFEILSSGPAAMQANERRLDSFRTMFATGIEEHPNVPPITTEAIIGGLWSIIQYELAHGRADQLPRLAPELTYIALTPFLGADEAALIATDRNVGTLKG